MRSAAITTALVAFSGVVSAAVNPNSFLMGTAADGNVTATVEMFKDTHGTDVVRITYTTVDVDNPERLPGSSVARLCWNFKACFAALAPTGVACAKAAAYYGFDFGADAACIAASTNKGANTPRQCDGCF